MHQDVLFDIGEVRAFHESESQQQEALAILRHRKLTKISFEKDWPGSRLAPAIDILRNGWGFDIAGTGARHDPYWMLNPNQSPQLVRTTDTLKHAYYDSEHWAAMREKRFTFDNHRCVLCTGSCRGVLQCHHIKYSLFNEKLDELMTVCEFHHLMIHENGFLKFPTGIPTFAAERLLNVVAYDFPDWLLP